ncbi:DNA methyltransferase [Mycobacterium phage BodEinwohner17]|uniref:DNA (cytosine-5-)-methyltransferase n=1 Tax=Mycobacterium phage BodEinwohner17 TaxID=2708630 RepID=A0A6G6XRS0_9CAUD|nr:DNA methyltransferase [Mycobacterium phage BodEinwohner17]QIG61469.1 DNA methylase [Mycobacterium phage BodEinwohner17]
MLTLTDLFCGAGGSSTGATMVDGIEVKCAANHWQLAVDTHAENHPTTDHRCADLSQVDPRLFPRTDIGWFSPSCTKHSIAQGLKRLDKQPDLFGETLPDAAAERSRATMWDVVRFSEYHHYQAVIVENVVDVYHWPPFQAWLAAMDSIGYAHHIVYLNSMHAQVFGPGAPQSRDRIYIVFWRQGNTAPDLKRVTRPEAHCTTCGPVRAMQVWKQPDRAPWGRYRAQYVYRCPSVKCRNQIVEPVYRPAAEIIDWTLMGQRIGDRDKPLAAKTLSRIQAGIERYWRPLLVPVEGRDGKQSAPVDQAARTMTTRNETGLAFIAELRGGGSKHRSVNKPLATVTASGNHHGLVTTYYGNGAVVPAGSPLPTCTTVERHALLTPTGGTWRTNATPSTDPIPTRTTRENDGVAMGPTLDVNDVLFRMLEPREIASAMDFPSDYRILGNRREQVRQAGNAVTPPAARDLVGVVAESLGVSA